MTDKLLTQQGIEEELAKILVAVRSLNSVATILKENRPNDHGISAFKSINDFFDNVSDHLDLLAGGIQESIMDLHTYLKHLDALPKYGEEK